MPSKPSQSAQPLLLAITLVSTVLAAFLLSRQPVAQAETSIANDRPDRPDRSDEIVVIPVAIKMGMEGIALVDKGHQTICIYQYQPHLPAHQRFSLLAARSFKYDVLLEDYNTGEPRPATVKELLSKGSSTDSAPAAVEEIGTSPIETQPGL